jgi:RimJ/RimL family protein N-acetyltransferase
MGFRADFRRHLTLEDGTQVVVRPIRPSDAAALRDGYAELSTASRNFRFLGAPTKLSDDVVRTLVMANGIDRVVLVAVQVSLDLKQERLVGGASYVRLPEKHVAEVSVTVLDDVRNRGLGEGLLRVLRDVARSQGIESFRAEVHEENGPVRHLLQRVGVEPHESADGVLVFDVPLDERPEDEERSIFEALLVAAANGVVRALARLAHHDHAPLVRDSERPTPDDLP